MLRSEIDELKLETKDTHDEDEIGRPYRRRLRLRNYDRSKVELGLLVQFAEDLILIDLSIVSQIPEASDDHGLEWALFHSQRHSPISRRKIHHWDQRRRTGGY
jgi:hypothetical protein